jgi:hypothetical protein
MAAAANSATPLVTPHKRQYGTTRRTAAGAGPSPAVRAVLARSDVLPRQILGFLPPLEALHLRLVNKAWSKAFVRKDDALWWLDNAARAVARDAAAVAVRASAPSSPTAAARARGRPVVPSTDDSVLMSENKRLVMEVLRLQPWGTSEMPPLPASTDRDVWLFWLYFHESTRLVQPITRAQRIRAALQRPERLSSHPNCLVRNSDCLCSLAMWMFPAMSLFLLPFQLQRVFDMDCVSHAYGWHQQHANVTDPLPFPSVLPDSFTLNPSSGHAAAPQPRVNWTFLNASLSDCGMDNTSLGFSMDPSGLPHDHYGASWSFAIMFIVSAVVSLSSTWLVKCLGGNYNPGDPPPRAPQLFPPALWRCSPCVLLFCPRRDRDWGAFDASATLAACWLFVPLILSWCAVFPDDTAPGITTAVALVAAVVVFVLAAVLCSRRQWVLLRQGASTDPKLRMDGPLPIILLVLLGAQGIMVALNQAMYWGCGWLGIPPAPQSDVPFRARDNPLPIAMMLIPSLIPLGIASLFVCILCTAGHPGAAALGCLPGVYLIVAVLSLQQAQFSGGASWFSWTVLSPWFTLILIYLLFAPFIFSGFDDRPQGRVPSPAGATMNSTLKAVNGLLRKELKQRQRHAQPPRAARGGYEALIG